MRSHYNHIVLSFLSIILFSPLSLCAKEIIFWHALEGFLYDKFAEIVDDFNQQPQQDKVTLVYKGNYTETFNRGMEAFDGGCQPHLLQVYEVATQTMVLQPHRFFSVEDLLRKHLQTFDPSIYIDSVKDFYSSNDGKLHSLPWNASTGILFYNKKAFADAGLDPEKPPKTWLQLEKTGKALVKAGYKGFTTAWPAAYHLEYTCSWHNLPFATHDNGFAGLEARLNFNGPHQIRHLQKLVDWQKQGIFCYYGRFATLPEKAFTDGECAILLQGSNRFSMLKKTASFDVGVGFLPYWSHIPSSPFRLGIGGSSFWAMSGFDDETYQAIAHFLAFLSLPEVQGRWHQQTGYLPITKAAYHLAKNEGFYLKNPAAEIAVLEVMNDKSTPYTKGIRLGNYIPLREKIIDYMEKAFDGTLTPKEALDGAVQEGDRLLEAFEAAQLFQ